MYVCVFICSYLVWFCWVQFSTKNWTLGFLPWCLRNGRASGMVAIQVHVSRSHLAYAKGPSRKLRWVVIRGSRDHLHSNHSKSVCVCAPGCILWLLTRLNNPDQNLGFLPPLVLFRQPVVLTWWQSFPSGSNFRVFPRPLCNCNKRTRRQRRKMGLIEKNWLNDAQWNLI